VQRMIFKKVSAVKKDYVFTV
jgi:hypothetical protein